MFERFEGSRAFLGFQPYTLNPQMIFRVWGFMSYSLNSMKGVIWGIRQGTTIWVIKGDTRSLDYSSYGFQVQALRFSGLSVCPQQLSVGFSVFSKV